MTYTKYIESGTSCFIPGKVLDEVVRILSLMQRSAKATLDGQSSNLPRAHELLQVLTDLQMASRNRFQEKQVRILDLSRSPARRPPKQKYYGPTGPPTDRRTDTPFYRVVAHDEKP